MFCDSAVPGVDPAPAELKLRSKSSVVREKAAAGGWCQRSKPDFVFHYSQLESELV